MSEYKKFCFWVDSHAISQVRRGLEEKRTELPEEARIPCRALRPTAEITSIAPPAWNGFCKRRTSWYRKSKRGGGFLIVSNSPLDLPDLAKPIIIGESDFRPDRLPSPEEIPQLIQSKEYQKNKPSQWDKPDPLEKEYYEKWFERNRISEPFDFGGILLSHSANHANFIDPKFFVKMSGSDVPYSIGDSLHVCSSCLEFFDILGDQWPVKYVVPCIGAVQFAHLPIDRYFEVKISS